jgi:hypothetical protein
VAIISDFKFIIHLKPPLNKHTKDKDSKSWKSIACRINVARPAGENPNNLDRAPVPILPFIWATGGSPRAGAQAQPEGEGNTRRAKEPPWREIASLKIFCLQPWCQARFGQHYIQPDGAFSDRRLAAVHLSCDRGDTCT